MKIKLPETKKEWEKLKAKFLTKYKLEDSPETWTFILSQLQGTKMPELTFSMDSIYAHYKRWKISKVLQDEKTVYIKELEDKLKAHFETVLSQGETSEGSPSPSEHPEHVREGSFYSEGDVPLLPELKETVVQTS